MAQSGMGGMGGYIPPTLRSVIHNPFALTQNQWYDVWLIESGEVLARCNAGAGSVKTNVRLHSVALDQAVGNETLEFRVIADDYDGTATVAAVAGTNYYLQNYPDPDGAQIVEWSSTIGNVMYRAFTFEAKSLQMMVRKTTAVGANNTTVKVIWAQW